MAVFRVEKNHNYTVMSNYHLRDTRLTLKSIGLLSKMLSLTDEWDYTTRGLATICKEGVDAIGAALKELELHGYLVRRQLRDSRGRITDTEYTIYESPHTPLPDTAPPDTENPYLDILCVAVNSGNCSVVLYANSDHATVRVGKCNQVNGKGFRVNPRALAVKERRFHRTTYLFNRHFAAHARTPSS